MSFHSNKMVTTMTTVHCPPQKTQNPNSILYFSFQLTFPHWSPSQGPWEWRENTEGLAVLYGAPREGKNQRSYWHGEQQVFTLALALNFIFKKKCCWRCGRIRAKFGTVLTLRFFHLGFDSEICVGLETVNQAAKLTHVHLKKK